MDPLPLADGAAVEVTILLHNDSAAVAAGSIVVQVAHDRGTTQPVPTHAEVVYVGADERVEITLTMPVVKMAASPYTFYAVVDAFDAVRESDELNNTAWERVAVCGSPQSAEVVDGFDNDCDGMSDEGLGLPPDAGEALRQLRAVQRQARLDAAPLIFTLPRLFAVSPVEHAARVVSQNGGLVGRAPLTGRARRRGGTEELGAALPGDSPRSLLALTDWNGGELHSGDLVSFRLPDGDTIVAEGDGGARLRAQALFRERERLLTIIKLEEIVEGARSAGMGAPIRSGDTVVLMTSTGHFVSAERGGGGELRADRILAGGWESFTLILEDGEIP
jgi:hypothetical protein